MRECPVLTGCCPRSLIAQNVMIRCLVYLMRILRLFGLLAIVVSVIVTGAPDVTLVTTVKAGMVVRLEKCGAIWCNVSVQGYEGWLRRAEVWGLYLDEQPK